MKKEFYIIIPFDKVEDSSVRDTSLLWPLKKFWTSMFWNNIDTLKIRSQLRNFGASKKWLLARKNMVQTWLENIWIKATELTKNELVNFLIDYYNPRLENFTEIKSDLSDYNLTS
jgi:hypothetical protein